MKSHEKSVSLRSSIIEFWGLNSGFSHWGGGSHELHYSLEGFPLITRLCKLPVNSHKIYMIIMENMAGNEQRKVLFCGKRHFD